MSSLELCNHVQCTQPGVFEFIDTIGTMCNTHKMQGMLKVRKFNVYEQARILKELQVARKKKTCSNANLITLVQTKFKLVPSRHDLKNWQQSFSQQDIKNALKAKKLAISEKRVTVFRRRFELLSTPPIRMDIPVRPRTAPQRLGRERTVELPPVSQFGSLHGCGWEVWVKRFEVDSTGGRKMWSFSLKEKDTPPALLTLIQSVHEFVWSEASKLTVGTIGTGGFSCLLAQPTLDESGAVVQEVKQQYRHIDYELDANMKQAIKDGDQHVPCSLIVALQDNTSISLWPFSHRVLQDPDLFANQRFHAQRVILNKGDCIIFRGDCVHVGESYHVQNFRLFTYLETATVKAFRGNSVYPTTYPLFAHADDRVMETLVPLPDEQHWLNTQSCKNSKRGFPKEG